MTPALSLEEVSVRHGGHQTLSNVSLAIEAGEVVALLGPSGSGKTSLVRLLLGLLPPASGAVRIEGELASADGRILVPPEERGLAVVFQDLALWPHLTVRGNLAFGLEARGVSGDERDERIAEALRRVGLTGKEDRRPAALSGGERQRVAIARALVLKPRAVLLDEPLSNLDVGLKRELLALFAELLGGGKATALFVTHDLREAAPLAGRMAIVEQGRLSQVGTLGELRARPGSPFVEALLEDDDAARRPLGARP